MEDYIPQQALSRYRKILESYKERLRTDPDIRLSEFCRETHTNYNGIQHWLKRNGISVVTLRREARGERFVRSAESAPAEAFIQFAPARSSISCNLRGVSITFPDGVNLTLQESSVESVISLLTVYQSRQGRAKVCSD